MALIVKSRRAMSSSSSIEASLTMAKSRCPGPVDRSARGGVRSMPAGTSARTARSRGCRRTPTSCPCTSHVLDAAVGLEERAQARLVDPGHEEVLVAVRNAEQLVADGAADDVGVDAERADVGADRGRHRLDCDASSGRRGEAYASAYVWATASISTSAPEGSFATSNVERAGGRSPTWRA